MIVSKEQAVKDLKEVMNFGDDWEKGYCTADGFGIHKRFMEREEVIEKLKNYFKDKMFIEGLGLEIGSITIIYTTFRFINIKIK